MMLAYITQKTIDFGWQSLSWADTAKKALLVQCSRIWAGKFNEQQDLFLKDSYVTVQWLLDLFLFLFY